MIKTSVVNIMDVALPMRLQPILKKIMKALTSLGSICVLSEDTLYKSYIKQSFMPELYRQHTSKMVANCVFCANLVRSGCHKYCLKCSSGTYVHCSPLLPGILYNETNYPYHSEILTVPWYYRETCHHFTRLPSKNYLKNFSVALSSIGIYNFEVLEGLEKGLSSGEKPCYVCASIDYELYKRCSGQVDFEPTSPCNKIYTELANIYQRPASQ